MGTTDLIDQILTPQNEVDDQAIAALHALLDDSMIESATRALGVAEAADVVHLSAHTLRYYEKEGLVRPARTSSGYRSYGPGDLRRLVFLTRMRLSGMPMSDLRRYIVLVDQGTSTTAERRAMMLAHRARIREQLRELQLSLAATEYKILAYGGAPDDENVA